MDAQKDVKSIAQNFFKKSGLNYFQYSSVFKDDRHFFLVTHGDFVSARIRAKRRILSHITKELLHKNLYMFLWNESLPQDDTNMAREYGIDNGLCFVERFKEHYNLIAFAAPLGYPIHNFYLNNIGEMIRFIREFEHRGKVLLEQAQKNKFWIPERLNDVNRSAIFAKAKNKTIVLNGLSFSLSRQELACLTLLSKGFSMQGISSSLTISPRTVETYLNRIKDKTSNNKKQELVELFYDEML